MSEGNESGIFRREVLTEYVEEGDVSKCHWHLGAQLREVQLREVVGLKWLLIQEGFDLGELHVLRCLLRLLQSKRAYAGEAQKNYL